jgi:hypothetical protein
MDIIAIDDKLNERDERQLIEFARRKAKPRFYADENFPGLATATLRGCDPGFFPNQRPRGLLQFPEDSALFYQEVSRLLNHRATLLKADGKDRRRRPAKEFASEAFGREASVQ